MEEAHVEATAAALPGSLRLLKALVITLMLVMIVGFIVLIGLFVTRLSGSAPTANPAQGPAQTEAGALSLPDTIRLPDGAAPEAFTATRDWYAIVTTSGQILVYNRADGALMKTIEVVPAD